MVKGRGERREEKKEDSPGLAVEEREGGKGEKTGEGKAVRQGKAANNRVGRNDRLG